jgi:hypothetical protein
MKYWAVAFAAVLVTVSAGARISQTHELFNYGRQWNVWSDTSRLIYLEGFVDGQSGTYTAVASDLPPERREPLRLQTFTFYDADALRDVMTSLYSDPANTYIRYDSVVYLSRDKLNGKDIKPSLMRAREADRGYAK